MAAFPDNNTTRIPYNIAEITALFRQILNNNTTAESGEWLHTIIDNSDTSFNLQQAFTQLPRKTGKRVLTVTNEQVQVVNNLVSGFLLEGWTADRLGRVFLLLQLNRENKEAYTAKIESLFKGAEINEQVALYSALPLFYYPQHWTKHCAEGIRSNMAIVLEAIMYHNPYPAAYLDGPGWNQMILKAFFTEKQVQKIAGLDERANPDLAAMLLNYAHERWAAHRTVHPLLWRCISGFISEKNFAGIQRIFNSENKTERAAAALACNNSAYLPAIALLNAHPTLKNLIASGQITWDAIAQNQINHSF